MEEASTSAPASDMHLIFLEDATPPEVETYYHNGASTVRVMNDPNHPIQPYKGVFASRRFEVGDEIFRESPLVAMLHLAGARTMLNCHECLGFVGESIDDQMEYFIAHTQDEIHPEKEKKKEKEEQENKNKKKGLEKRGCGVSCTGGCDEVVYCSEACRDASWKRHHSLMCSGIDHHGKEWWEAFYEHAQNTNDIFILAAKAMSMVLLDAYDRIMNHNVSPREGLVEAWKPFKMGYKKRWWESVALPSDVDPGEEDQFRADLKEIANDSFTLYSHAVELGHPDVYSTCRDIIHIDIWGSLIGMFELNNLSIIGPGPCSIFECDQDHIEQVIQSESLVEEFTDAIVEGTGFFRLHSCMNHSCEPNCRAMLPETNSEYNKAIIQAIKPIDPGTELTVSYIDEDEPYDVRREQLQDYGFVCLCPKCCVMEGEANRHSIPQEL